MARVLKDASQGFILQQNAFFFFLKESLLTRRGHFIKIIQFAIHQPHKHNIQFVSFTK